MNLNEYHKRSECKLLIFFVQSLVHTQISKIGIIYTFMIRNSKSFIAQILKALTPLGKSSYFGPLGFEIQLEKNYDIATLEFKLHSFRGFQRYLTDKNPTHDRGTVSVFQFSACSF